MRTARRVLLALGSWLICASAAATALDTLSDCAASASIDAEGLAALTAECPGLDSALNELALDDHLPEGWQDHLNLSGLQDLATLVRHYQGSPQNHIPGVSTLPGILHDLAGEQPQAAKSWWDAVKEWLRSWAERNPENESGSWLARLLQNLKPSELILRIVLYGLLGLVVISAIVVVANELRAAGLLARSKRTATQATCISTDQVGIDAVTTLGDLERAALHDKPAILLRLLVTRLLAARRLKVERSLTHRELGQQGEFANTQQRERFTQVATLAEQVLYGSMPTAPEHIERVVADGQALLQQLEPTRSVRT